MLTSLDILHLSLLPNIGPAAIIKFLSKFDNFNININDLLNVGFSAQQSVAIIEGIENKKLLEDELFLIDKYKVGIVTIFDNNYPKLLKQIYLPPVILYYKGEELGEESKLAIVGSRKANSYSEKVCNYLVPELVKNDFTIVSGGAIGADSMAHKAALEVKGKTIVVLGSGLLSPYPVSNNELFKKVINNGGTLISSFALRTQPLKWNFPARNRVIAGLSKGCLVLQASKKSGAAITAQFALEQGRQVFAIPGSIFDEFSEGCHDLIKQGAKVVHSINDILEELLFD